MATFSETHGAVTGGPRGLLRLEGLLVLGAATTAYALLDDASWKVFFLFFFVPDISLLAYLIGKKAGAFFYNASHFYGAPIIAGFVLWYLDQSDSLYFVLIWIAHIGFDRALGYGLKYDSGFKFTHLGRIGR